ncbi:hypothetical protein VitviT2T_003634 [Vitis vinifera]|nr:hypothetical protein VitviT2T_003634 [Vitis vinifera]
MDAAVTGVRTVPDAGDMETFVVSAGDDTEDAALAVREEGAISAGVTGAMRGCHWRILLGAPSFA